MAERSTHFIIVIALLAATSILLAVMPEVAVLNDFPVRDTLPDTIGAYRGEPMFYCQSKQCLKVFTEDDLGEAQSCRACGGELDHVSLGEKVVLPADTEILRKRYVQDGGRAFVVSVVVSGKERRSIHRPQRCLVAQGNVITGQKALPVVRMKGKERLSVMFLDVSYSAPGRPHPTAWTYAYYFVGGRRETPHHFRRLIWAAASRIFKGKSHRWAYVSVSSELPMHTSAAVEQISSFMAQLHDAISLPDNKETQPE
jgi:hypothetical protein